MVTEQPSRLMLRGAMAQWQYLIPLARGGDDQAYSVREKGLSADDPRGQYPAWYGPYPAARAGRSTVRPRHRRARHIP